MHKTSPCISRPWSNSATHRPTIVPMPEKLGKDSNPNPNLKLLPMTETGKPKTTKKLPSKLDWKTPSPSRRRPPKPQQHQYKNPLRISRMEGSNPTLPNTHLVDTGMYTARRNRGSPQPPVPSWPLEARGNQRNRRRKSSRSRFALFFTSDGERVERKEKDRRLIFF